MQLYELDGDPRRKEFLDDLFSFMQKRGESPAVCPPCAHSVPTLLHHTHLTPPQARGLLSLPLISAPRSQLWLSCWLIFNPAAQRGQTCWAGSSACGPPLAPLPSPIPPRPAAPPHTTPLAVCPLCPYPGLLQGAKPLTVPSLCPGRGHSKGPGMGRAESQACSCSRVWFLRGKQPGSADTGLAPALCQTALGRHMCLHKGGWGCRLSSPGFPWFHPVPWLCPMGSPWLCPL